MLETTVSWLGLIWGILVLVAITDYATFSHRNPDQSRKIRHRRLILWLRLLGVYLACTIVVVIIMACVMTVLVMKS